MFEEILSKIGAILKNSDMDIQYIRRWLKEFDKSSDKKDFLKTFEKVLMV
jgi:hypothetical protein